MRFDKEQALGLLVPQVTAALRDTFVLYVCHLMSEWLSGSFVSFS